MRKVSPGIVLPMLAFMAACGGPSVEPEVVAEIAAALRSSGAGPGRAPASDFALGERLAHHSVPGLSIALVDGGRLLWARGFGTRRAGATESITPATLFQAASISKPIAATGMLRMVDDGRLDLDRSVEAYLTSWRMPDGRQSAEHPVTLRRIASHSAGFTVRGFPGYADGERLPTVQEILRGDSPANTSPVTVGKLHPGETYRYSGGGYVVMQLIMTDVSGESFPSLMRELVLTPLGMERSTFAQPLPAELWDQATVGHDENGNPLKGRWRTYPELAAAGLWTTPTDLMRWARELAAVRNGSSEFLSRELVVEMLAPQMESVGLGPMLSGTGESFRFSHSGGNRGFRGTVVYYPETGQGAAILTNGDNGAPLGREVLAALAEVYHWPETKDGDR